MATAVAVLARFASFFLRRTPNAVPWSLRPYTDAVHRAPGHNRWGVTETSLPADTREDFALHFEWLATSPVAVWLLHCVAETLWLNEGRPERSAQRHAHSVAKVQLPCGVSPRKKQL